MEELAGVVHAGSASIDESGGEDRDLRAKRGCGNLKTARGNCEKVVFVDAEIFEYERCFGETGGISAESSARTASGTKHFERVEWPSAGSRRSVLASVGKDGDRSLREQTATEDGATANVKVAVYCEIGLDLRARGLKAAHLELLQVGETEVVDVETVLGCNVRETAFNKQVLRRVVGRTLDRKQLRRRSGGRHIPHLDALCAARVRDVRSAIAHPDGSELRTNCAGRTLLAWVCGIADVDDH